MSVINFHDVEKELTQFHLNLLDLSGPTGAAPGQMFHYTTAAGLCGILEGKMIWATDVRCMNDPSELRYSFDLARDVLRTRADCISQCILEAFKREDLLDLGKDFWCYMTCFCTEDDLPSQWRDYGKPGDRFAIQVSTCGLSGAGTDYEISKRVYDRTEQKSRIRQVLDFGQTLFNKYVPKDGDADRLLGKIGRELASIILPFKHPAFHKEHEVRLLVIHHDDKEHWQRIKYRSAPGQVLPYIEIPFDPASCVSGVIVGPGMQSFNVATTNQMLKSLGVDAEARPSYVPLM